MTDLQSIGDAIHFIRGITFKPDELVQVGSDDAVVCMRTKNVQADLDESDIIAVPRRLVRNPEKFLRTGDILISSANSWDLVGKVSYVGDLRYPATAGGFISIVRPKLDRVSPRFLYHWLNSAKQQHCIRNLGRQTTNISNLDVGRFKELPFPAISLSEQERIAGILDKSDRVCRMRDRVMRKSNDFLLSSFLELFGDPVTNPKGWPITTLGENGDVQGGLQVTRARDNFDLQLPYLRVANVYRGRLELHELKKIGLTQSELSRTRLVEGDILIVEGHGNPEELGRAARWDGSVDPCVHQNHLIRFRANRSRLLPIYTEFVLNSPGGRLELTNAGRTTSGLNTISTRKVKEVSLPLPPLAEQMKFEHLVIKTSQMLGTMQRSFDVAEDLFAALCQRAFAGKL